MNNNGRPHGRLFVFHLLVRDTVEVHPEGTCYIEWRERKQRFRSPVAREGAVTEARKKAVETAGIRDGLIAVHSQLFKKHRRRGLMEKGDWPK
jgi:hypothetical protein